MSGESSIKFLVVIPHPDDASYFCGGSLVRWAKAGHEIYIATLTDGSKGSLIAVDPQQLAERRREEKREAAKWLGAREVFFFNYVDGDLDRATDLVERLTGLYRRLQPQVLVAQDPWKPYEFHPDHRTAAMAALDARLPAKLPTYFHHQLTDGVRTCEIHTLLLYHTDQPNLWVDVTKTVKQKFEALFSHRSQFADCEMEVRTQLMRELEEQGKRINVAYAEAFKRIDLDNRMPTDFV